MKKSIIVTYATFDDHGKQNGIKDVAFQVYWNEKTYSGGRRYVKISTPSRNSGAVGLIWLAEQGQWQRHGCAYGFEQDVAEALGFIETQKDEFHTVAQAAIVWGVSKSTVYRWITNGRVSSSKMVVKGRLVLCVSVEVARKAA